MSRILCVDDEAAAVLILEDTLQRAGHQTVGVRNVEAALNVLARGGVDLIVSDYAMPDITGMEFLEILDDKGYDVPLIMVTGHATVEHAVQALKAGAVDYITKPIRPAHLEVAVEQALEMLRLQDENARLREEVGQLRSRQGIVGESEALKRILETAATVAATRTTVLLQGESGTGKELLARTIHNMSDRGDGSFISVNCAALPENLVESTLFGHEKGAFTGATRQVKGAFERADKGTLLLDEVSEMRLDLQAKLLRALQEQEFERVGGSSLIRVDVRIIATTNRDLKEHVDAGRFREDLFYRLNVVPIELPPLRERPEDIPLLVKHFTRRAAAEADTTIRTVHPDTLDLLASYPWPGNVRELANAVERAVVLTDDEVLRPEAFERQRFGLTAGEGGRSGLPASGGASPGAGSKGAGDLDAVSSEAREPGGPGILVDTFDLDEVEEILIEKALEATGGNRTKAAELLGITSRTLRNKLNKPEPDGD